MPSTEVTVVIPTYNRSRLLRLCLESVLAQDYSDFQVMVLDNASIDDTEAIVNSFANPRLTYIKNEVNIGQLFNWNRAIALNSSPYLNIFHDDDIMLPGFIRNSVQLLDVNPRVAFSFTLARNIDVDGNPLGLEGMIDVPTGVISGMDFLHSVASGCPNPIPPSSVMMRASALASVGLFDSPHSRHMIDRNMYYRIASRYDIIHIRKELIHLRCHPEQERERLLSTNEKYMLAVISDRIDAIAYLLRSDRAEDSSYREWLEERLVFWNSRLSEFIHIFVPDSYWTWTERLNMASREIAEIILPNDQFILVDVNKLGSESFEGYHVVPYLERDGQYWGAPSDDNTAIRELERLRRSGASFMIFAWPGFWWLEHYSGLRDYLSLKYRCVLQNSRLIVFDLRP